jgi:hypothetical protein
VTYAAQQLLDEVAYVAFHYHWSLDAVLDLEHADRRHFAATLEQLLPADAE